MNDIISKINYTTDRRIITSSNILEYDIRQANINMLYSYGKISLELYTTLKNLPKDQREIYIGNMIKYTTDENLYDVISGGISRAKVLLAEANNIQADSIVRIANDAVYVETPYELKYTKFVLTEKGNEVEFICKNRFTSFLQFSNSVKVFFSILPSDDFNIDVKGIGKMVNLHESFLSFIAEILFYKERTSPQFTLSKYMEFYEAYINRKLDISYYREFNPSSIFRLMNDDKRCFKMYPIYSNGISLQDIDIRYNLSLLRELYSMILS